MDGGAGRPTIRRGRIALAAPGVRSIDEADRESPVSGGKVEKVAPELLHIQQHRYGVAQADRGETQSIFPSLWTGGVDARVKESATTFFPD